MSALESGKISLHSEAVDLRALMMNVEAIMRPMAIQKGLCFHLPDLPEEPV
jgi:signal transduction histidine kinase